MFGSGACVGGSLVVDWDLLLEREGKPRHDAEIVVKIDMEAVQRMLLHSVGATAAKA